MNKKQEKWEEESEIINRDFSNEIVIDWLEDRYETKSIHTYRNDKCALKKFEKYIGEKNLGLDDVKVYHANKYLKNWLTKSEGLYQLSAYNYFMSTKSFYQWYLDMFEIDRDNPFSKIDTDYIDHTERANEKENLDADQIREIIECVGQIRNKAILAFTASTGCRIGEAVRLKKENLDIEGREAEIITLKNRKQKDRKVYFDRYTRRLLDDYVNRGYRDKYADSESDYVFVSANDNQHTEHPYVSVDRVQEAFRQAVDKSGIEQEFTTQPDEYESKRSNITTHILRRSFCQHWVNSGGDIMNLKNHQGWQNLETAKQYLSDDVDRETRDTYGLNL